MSTKKPPSAVNNLGYFKRPVSGTNHSVTGCDLRSRLLSDGTSIADPTPIVVPVRLPSIAQRVAAYERAGAIRQDYFLNVLTEEDISAALSDDDFGDHLDDLPEEGLSRYELVDSDVSRDARSSRAARKKAADAAKLVSATTLPGGAPKPLPTSVEAPPEPPKAAS